MKVALTKFRLIRQAIERYLLVEIVFVAGVGVAFGLLANGVSPKGIALARNYFPPRPAGTNLMVTAARPELPVAVHSGTNLSLGVETSVAARLKQNGLQMVDGAQAWELFNDPRYQQQQVVFIDARDDRHYTEGHIPGAYQFDRYHPENYLLSILGICQSAEVIVVYCNGGECEDSEFAAIMLRDAGVPGQKLFVYSSGMTEWISKKFPLKSGDQP